MRWKHIVTGALFGALLGFSTQFFVDFFCWVGFFEARAVPPKAVTAYQFIQDGSFEQGVAETELARRWQKRLVMTEGMFLDWLAACSALGRGEETSRGELAVRLASLSAFLVSSGVFAADILHKRRMAKDVPNYS